MIKNPRKFWFLQRKVYDEKRIKKRCDELEVFKKKVSDS